MAPNLAKREQGVAAPRPRRAPEARTVRMNVMSREIVTCAWLPTWCCLTSMVTCCFNQASPTHHHRRRRCQTSRHHRSTGGRAQLLRAQRGCASRLISTLERGCMITIFNPRITCSLPTVGGRRAGETQGDTRAHTGTRIKQTNLTTIQTHQHIRTTARRPNPRPTQQPQPVAPPPPPISRAGFDRGAWPELSASLTAVPVV